MTNTRAWALFARARGGADARAAGGTIRPPAAAARASRVRLRLPSAVRERDQTPDAASRFSNGTSHFDRSSSHFPFGSTKQPT